MTEYDASGTPKTTTVSARLDPRGRFALNLVARVQRRSMSAVLEGAIEELARTTKIRNTRDGTEETAHDLVDRLWSPNQFETFLAMAMACEHLLDYEEQRRWHVIRSTPEFWYRHDPAQKETFHTENFRWSDIRLNLENIEKAVEEKANRSPVGRLGLDTLFKLGLNRAT